MSKKETTKNREMADKVRETGMACESHTVNEILADEAAQAAETAEKEKTAASERGPEQTVAEDFEKTAMRVSWVSIFGNTVLFLIKLAAGILAHSGAMVSDAIHSGSDVFSTVIVIIGVRISAREADAEHPYGHERFESLAAIILSIVLLVTGLFMGHTAIETLRTAAYTELMIPGIAALAAAVLSIISKEAMYQYTRFYAKRIDSDALMADAWHHRSDALSSIGSLIGIAGARMGYAWFDPAACLVICVFIVKAAYDIFMNAISKMVDKSCSDEMCQGIRECVLSDPDVMGIKTLLTREFGNRIYVELEVYADGNMTLKQSNAVACRVHGTVERKYSKIKHISVMLKPCE